MYRLHIQTSHSLGRPTQADSIKAARKASLSNSRGRIPAVNYNALQRTAQTVPMVTIAIHKRTLRPAYTAVGPDVIPRFLCVAAGEVGDLVADKVEVFFKPWEDRVAALAAKPDGVDYEKAKRLLNALVAKSAREMPMEVEKINIRRPVPMLARSFVLFWMRMFFEAMDAVVMQCA